MSAMWEGVCVWGEGVHGGRVCVCGGRGGGTKDNLNTGRPPCHINLHMQKILGRSYANI